MGAVVTCAAIKEEFFFLLLCVITRCSPLCWSPHYPPALKQLLFSSWLGKTTTAGQSVFSFSSGSSKAVKWEVSHWLAADLISLCDRSVDRRVGQDKQAANFVAAAVRLASLPVMTTALWFVGGAWMRAAQKKKKKNFWGETFCGLLEGHFFPYAWLALIGGTGLPLMEPLASSYVGSVIASSHTTVWEAHTINRVQNGRN